MDLHYLALIDGVGCYSSAAWSISEERLAAMEMRAVAAPRRVRLYVSRQMPVIELPDGGTLIGHVFARDGTLVTDNNRWSAMTMDFDIRRDVIDNLWGHYLLLQPDAKADGGLSVMRSPSPSGDLPCFYALNDGAGFITSDISFPTQLGLYSEQVDWTFIELCLAYPHEKMARTGLSGVRELLPGSRIVVGKHVAVETAWSPWKFVDAAQRHSRAAEAAAEVRGAVCVSVRSLASMEEAILLEVSGGLDSSIVGVCLRGSAARVSCCTLVTPVRGADERSYAVQIAQALGSELTAEHLQFEDVRFQFDPPSHLLTPRLGALQNAIADRVAAVCDRSDIAACFSGGGGDAVFDNFSTAAPAVDAFRELGMGAGIAAVHDLAALHGCTFWKAGRLALSKMRRAPAPPLKEDLSFLGPAFSAPTIEPHPWLDAPADALPGDRERIFGLATNQLFRESVPRGAGRRLRMPLLSQPVVEACLKVPSWMWIAGGCNRAIARSAFQDLLPADVLNRRSKGTFIAYLGGVYRRSKDQMRDYLLSGELQARGLLDGDALVRFFATPPLPRDDSFTRIFELCMIENWIRHRSASSPRAILPIS
ncbi:asparagine synthase-related protein [Luteimonas sp. A482]